MNRASPAPSPTTSWTTCWEPWSAYSAPAGTLCCMHCWPFGPVASSTPSRAEPSRANPSPSGVCSKACASPARRRHMTFCSIEPRKRFSVNVGLALCHRLYAQIAAPHLRHLGSVLMHRLATVHAGKFVVDHAVCVVNQAFSHRRLGGGG